MALNLTQGAAREAIAAADVAALRRGGVLVADPRRERPRYFDGRFLAARDLIRDQQYFLTREADLGRAAGSGVAHGLQVEAGATPQSLRLAAGQGITPAGELVLLPEDLPLNLADIPQAEQLSARFGLGRLPVAPMRSRTGLFILALRPVEFTANPVGAYPTSLTGARSVEDGDVIEATAVVLVPWQDDGAADALDARRGRAARSVFTQDGSAATSANLLPLAMLALQGNSLVWLDQAMVRRELGADRGDLPGLGFSPRTLRLAHLLQHQDHLADVVAQFNGRPFAAATQFPALPPAGPLPPGVINPVDFTQRYFPPEVDVDFSIIPEDELPALVEESLALPPIDFLASEAALDLTAVLLLAPVPRADFRSVLARLSSRSRPLKPAAPNRLAQHKPLQILQRLRLPLALDVADPANPSDAEWMRLARLPTLWFVRRRNLAYRDDLAGAPVAVSGRNERLVEDEVRERITTLGLGDALNRVLGAASSQAVAGVFSLLATPQLVASATLTAASLGALAARIAPAAADLAGAAVGGASAADAATPAGIARADVLAVSAEMAGGTAGRGLARLAQASPRPVSRSALINLASNDAWRRLDAAALAAAPALLPQLANRLRRGAAAERAVDPVPAATAAAREAVAAREARGARTAPAAQTGTPGTPGTSGTPGRTAKAAKPGLAAAAAAPGAQPAPAADAAQPGRAPTPAEAARSAVAAKSAKSAKSAKAVKPAKALKSAKRPPVAGGGSA